MNMAYRRNVTVGSGMATGQGVERKGKELWMELSLKEDVQGGETVNNVRDTRKKRCEYTEVKYGRHKKLRKER